MIDHASPRVLCQKTTSVSRVRLAGVAAVVAGRGTVMRRELRTSRGARGTNGRESSAAAAMDAGRGTAGAGTPPVRLSPAVRPAAAGGRAVRDQPHPSAGECLYPPLDGYF